jgi:hypothetical protein
MRKTKDSGHRSINEATRAERHAAENSPDTTKLSPTERATLEAVLDGNKTILGWRNTDTVQVKVNVPQKYVDAALEKLKRDGLVKEHSNSGKTPSYEIRYVATPKGVRALKRQ